MKLPVTPFLPGLYVKKKQPINNLYIMRKTQTLCQLIVFVVVLLTLSPAFAKMVSIKYDNVNMRSGPGTNYRVMWKLGQGFPLIVLKKKGNWLRVKDFENTIGWIHKKLTVSTPHMIVKRNRQSSKRVNIRSGPGTNYKIVGKAYYGVVFRSGEQKSSWVQVQHKSGVKGWIKRSFVWGW